jgi:hypothetical protein
VAQHDRLISWADIFDDCDFDVKKMIVSQIVSKVLVSRGYEIKVELSLSMKQYQEISQYGISIPA